MSPRHFWNHPLQELARSLVHTLKPGEPGQLSNDEFTEFLARLVGTAAAGPMMEPIRSPARRREMARLERER
jgi:hypothetical protein